MESLTPGSLDHAETLADLAGTLHDQDQLDSAAQLYQQALGELEVKTAGLGGVDEDRSRYRAQHDRYRREYVDVLMAQGHGEIAFQVLEGSRGRTLLETLSRDQVNIREGVNTSLLDHERDLRQSLNAKTQYRIRLLNGEHAGAQLAAVDAEAAELLDRYQQVEAEIRTKSPKYAALTQPQPLSVKEIQQLLDPETTLLEYSLGEERSFVWVVGQDSLAAYELPKRSEIESVARRAYQLLTVRNSHGPKGETETETEARWAKADADYFKTATNLSRMVLGPVEGLLQGKRLLIVSDGALQYIPFSALPTPDKPRTPLMVEHEVVNLPSASVVAELRRAALGRKEPLKAVAVLADPVFDASDERLRKRTGTRIDSSTVESSGKLGPWSKGSSSAELLTRSAADLGFSRDGRSYLNRLIYSRQEAESIMAVTPVGKGMKILDFEASRSRAMSSDLAQFQIIHFATHGLLDSKHPELSGLILSMIDRHGKSQDGFLGLQDIYNLNLPVELVVLSACETGLGEEISGEGLIGLTRGFMYAGASRVVASLWSVSDVGTAELMGHFYKAMEQNKLRPAAALRTAQITMWKQKRWRSPYYWAAFQLQGEWK
jgi:CHAT domain-containing protein